MTRQDAADIIEAIKLLAQAARAQGRFEGTRDLLLCHHDFEAARAMVVRAEEDGRRAEALATETMQKLQRILS